MKYITAPILKKKPKTQEDVLQENIVVSNTLIKELKDKKSEVSEYLETTTEELNTIVEKIGEEVSTLVQDGYEYVKESVETKEKEVDTFIEEKNTELIELTEEITKKVDDEIKRSSEYKPEIDYPSIVEQAVNKIPKVDENKLITEILSRVPQPKELDETKLINKLLKQLPEKKGDLKIIQERVETDPLSVIEKIMELAEAGKLKLKSKHIDGLEQTISAFNTQLSRGYLHGGGISDIAGLVTAGTNITITGNGTSISPYVVSSTGGGGTPGGSTLQLQYNNASVFGGMQGTSWNNTNRELSFDNNNSSSTYADISGTDKTGTPNKLKIYGGDSTSSGNGGAIDIISGIAKGTGNTSGAIRIIASSGALNSETNGGDVTIGAGQGDQNDGTTTAGRVTIQGARGGDSVLTPIRFKQEASGSYFDLDMTGLTADRTYTAPDKSGTLAMLSDITGGSPGGVTDSIQTNDGAGGFFGNANLTYDGTKFMVGDSTGNRFEYDFSGAPMFNFMSGTDRIFQTDLSSFATVIGNPDNLGGQGHYICVDPFASMSGYEGFQYGVNTGSGYDPYVLMDYFNITLFKDVKLKFDANTPPTAERELAYDDAQKVLAVFSGGIQQDLVTAIFTQTEEETVAGTTSERTIIGSGTGTLTLPADFFIVGKSIEYEIRGVHSSTGNPNITIKCTLGGATIATTGAVASGNGTNDGFVIKGIITCRSVGSSGTVASSGEYQELHNSGKRAGIKQAGATTIDTTTSQNLNITVTWGTASAGNTITSQVATFKIIN